MDTEADRDRYAQTYIHTHKYRQTEIHITEKKNRYTDRNTHANGQTRDTQADRKTNRSINQTRLVAVHIKSELFVYSFIFF